MRIIDYILENNFNEFFDKYGDYENVSISSFEHIKDKSTYNHNYYKGLVRNGKQDLLYVICDELYETYDVYIVNDNKKIYIGYAYYEDDKINLSETPLT